MGTKTMKIDRRDKFIGIFDSGFGGLNILRTVIKELPNYKYIYLGDTARSPYGARSKEVVYKFTEQAVDFLFKNNCELIILACNTASSEALRKIQQDYLPKNYPRRRVLGVLIPAAEEAVEISKNKRVGVMATEGTVNSGAFAREIKKLDPRMKVFQKACPLLVPLVEAREEGSKAADLILKSYLKPLVTKNVDTLVLGCTHYDVLRSKVRKIIGPKTNIISESEILPKKLKDYLRRHKEIKGKLGNKNRVEFYSTDLTDKFAVLGGKFFGKRVRARKVTFL
jgi:glutamate racemase